MADTAAQRRQLVRHRAGERCEYCPISTAADVVPFHLEHVVARQHGGPTTLTNLALACNRCNAHKGPNLTGIDPTSGSIVPYSTSVATRGTSTSLSGLTARCRAGRRSAG